MKRWSQVVLCAFLLLPLTFAQAALPTTDGQGRALPSLAPLLKKVTPAVVNIATYTTRQVYNPMLQDPFFRRFFNLPEQQQQSERQAQSAGSGVIIDAKRGLVLTNHHVIDNADEIRVSLSDKREYKAKLIGSDTASDLALLKIKADNLTALPLGNSDKLEVGDFLIAIGNPFGLGQTVTTGIVSALGRTGLGIEGVENFIQTDASINPGNSGGALINLKGELVGINTAIIAPGGGNVGIGFAIPSSEAKTVVKHLKRDGKVNRGVLGVVMQDLTPDLSQAFGMQANQGGVVITQVVKGSEAARAGIQNGDVVLSINGHKVDQAAQLRSRLGLLTVGDPVTLDILHDGHERTISTHMGRVAVNDSDGASYSKQLSGASLANNDQGSGVVIVNIKPNSRAAYVGLRPHDRIVSANRIKVNNLQDLKKAAARSGQLLLLIDRQGSAIYLALSS